MSENPKVSHCHVCKAGREKIVVMYDGRIIPCEAFKGAIDAVPELVLGTIESTTLQEAREKAEKVLLLASIHAREDCLGKWRSHQHQCSICQDPDDLCKDGRCLLTYLTVIQEVLSKEQERMRERIKEYRALNP